jgi:hypothetical protein
VETAKVHLSFAQARRINSVANKLAASAGPGVNGTGSYCVELMVMK